MVERDWSMVDGVQRSRNPINMKLIQTEYFAIILRGKTPDNVWTSGLDRE